MQKVCDVWMKLHLTINIRIHYQDLQIDLSLMISHDTIKNFETLKHNNRWSLATKCNSFQLLKTSNLLVVGINQQSRPYEHISSPLWRFSAGDLTQPRKGMADLGLVNFQPLLHTLAMTRHIWKPHCFHVTRSKEPFQLVCVLFFTWLYVISRWFY